MNWREVDSTRYGIDEFINEIPTSPGAMIQHNGPTSVRIIEPAIKLFSDRIDCPATLLDVGCESGHSLKIFNRYIQGSFHYKGIDIWPPVIEWAKLIYGDEKFEVGDLFNIKGLYDYVFCSRVLLHLPNFELAVEKLISVTNRLCCLVIPLAEKKYCKRFERNGEIHYFRTFSYDELKALKCVSNIDIYDLDGIYSTVFLT